MCKILLIENTFKGKLDDKNTSNILVKYSVNHRYKKMNQKNTVNLFH